MPRKSRATKWNEAMMRLSEASLLINDIAEGVEEQIENMPQSLRDSSKYDALMDLQSELEGYIENLDEVLEAEPEFF